MSEDAVHLSDMLRNDMGLRRELGCVTFDTAEQFLARTNKWMRRRKGQVYTIYLGRNRVGIISTSLEGLPKNHVRIGYWIGSSYWNRGVGSAAFRLVLLKAVTQGAEYAIATIPKDATASLKIWQKYGSALTDVDGHYSLKLPIKFSGLTGSASELQVLLL
jgi:ribosomal-protein-alanine N-acetyltransferase